jgi:aspartate-semialdehyde dehydrogenase
MANQYNVAVVGATGAVGETLLSILAEREFPVGEVAALASSRSAGKDVQFGQRTLKVQDLEAFDFADTDIALFSAGGAISAEHAPRAAAAGCVVIDNTSHFRNEPDVPLVVPEVNPQALAGYRSRGIIANPNCSTIQMLVALKPLEDAAGIERINVATYQAVSGTGHEANEELANQTANLLNGRPIEPSVYPRQIAFNCLPHIDAFQANGYTREEMKMVWETQKLLGRDDIRVNPTTVRVPVFYGHSEAVNIETREPVDARQARDLLSSAPGVIVFDGQEDGGYPTAIGEGSGQDRVYVGRIRADISHERGLNLWVVADNVRKGAALNSVQIAEQLIKAYI